MKLNLLGLEPYRQRYTEMLQQWEVSAFTPHFSSVDVIEPTVHQTALDIQSGSVLDSINRPVWAMQQMLQLIQRPGAVEIGKTYCSDFFTPGLESLAYTGLRFQISSFCWAQTFDCFDFTTAMMPWMRPWEIMAFNIYEHVFVACDGLKELIVTALPHVSDKVHVVGLPFNSTQVQSLLKMEDMPGDRFDVVYSSRWDKEKNPGLFLDLVAKRDDLRFAICTGHNELRGSETHEVQRANEMAAKKGNLVIFKGLNKSRYYGVLSASEVQFNCALQDWVSFTLLEALTFGCRPLYPHHRSFPDALEYSAANLYRPFDLEDANNQLTALLASKRNDTLRNRILGFHDGSLDRIAKVLKG